MPLSLNEIKSRAAAFAKDYEDAANEKAEAQSFLIDFFNVFGINQRKVSTFEQKITFSCYHTRKIGYIDLFWKKKILIEMKSRGKDLEEAYKQARIYADSLPENQLPKVILVCDFHTFHYYDLDNNNKRTVFTLEKLADHIELFTFMAGYQKRVFPDQDPVNLQAAKLMGKVHDQLKAIGYEGHVLEVYLVRILFCLFADDTAIFRQSDFQYYLKERTAEDGSDLGSKLAELFFILNTPEEKRLKTLDEQLNNFPYIDGKLFEESLPFVSFDSNLRSIILECTKFDWSCISPAIFGAMFQSVMDPKLRRELGAHYTSEENILKVIKPLFLDDLRKEFEHLKSLKTGRKARLEAFHDKIASLKFLDPACGCGNFLVIAYRELRQLEIEILQEIFKVEIRVLDISFFCKVDVDQFYGIEIVEFPAQIATVALWLMDHLMNIKVRKNFGQYFIRIPLKNSPKILCANALRMKWEDLVPKEELNYILGNPPFGGARLMLPYQKEDLLGVFSGVKNNGNLDYVTCWYKMAAEYIQGTNIEVGFVSTNSITQGEQPAILWNVLNQYGIVINFAHQTFKWSNEASGKAAVYCVIIGFSDHHRAKKHLSYYRYVEDFPQEIPAERINAYLVDGPNILISSRTKPICDVPSMGIGNQPIDNGNYLFTNDEKQAFLKIEPQAKPYFYRWYGADEFINNRPRWCLWLGELTNNELRKMPESKKRVDAVQKYRDESKRQGTKKLASLPTRFQVENRPNRASLFIPCVSSEGRNYIPIGFIKAKDFASNAALIVPDATLYHFGVLTSWMHMVWTRYVCGRLEGRYRYSKDVVYNNFPWPEPTGLQQEKISEAARRILDVRKKYPTASLADLYDPLATPKDLLTAHNQLNRLVEKAYRREKFDTDTERASFLFERYQQLAQAVDKPE